MQGLHGVVAEVDVPEAVVKYNKLELDFTLGCPGNCSSP